MREIRINVIFEDFVDDKEKRLIVKGLIERFFVDLSDCVGKFDLCLKVD